MTELQLGFKEYELAKRKFEQELELESQKLQETERHNKESEGVAREQLLIGWFDANSGRMNAETNRLNYGVNAKNAESNAMNAETNRLNYYVNKQNADTNAYNASTNRMNAETNRMNAQTMQYSARTDRMNALTNQRNAATNEYNAQSNRIQANAAARNAATQADRVAFENRMASEANRRANELQPYELQYTQARAAQASASALDTLNKVDAGYWQQFVEYTQQQSQESTARTWGQWIKNVGGILTLPANVATPYLDMVGSLKDTVDYLFDGWSLFD
jgi:hypothetical protein